MKTTEEQTTALQVIRMTNDISTPAKLAAVISNPNALRYYQLSGEERIRWLANQINLMNLMCHNKATTEMDIAIDAALTDRCIMDQSILRALTLVEIQEALQNGICREYGDFYGITAPSIISFLRGFLKSEKKIRAEAIAYENQKKAKEEATSRFWKEIFRAVHEDGFELPEFTNNVDLEEAYKKHRRMIASQREVIYRDNDRRVIGLKEKDPPFFHETKD